MSQVWSGVQEHKGQRFPCHLSICQVIGTEPVAAVRQTSVPESWKAHDNTRRVRTLASNTHIIRTSSLPKTCRSRAFLGTASIQQSQLLTPGEIACIPSAQNRENNPILTMLRRHPSCFQTVFLSGHETMACLPSAQNRDTFKILIMLRRHPGYLRRVSKMQDLNALVFVSVGITNQIPAHGSRMASCVMPVNWQAGRE
jgi:hypothetical protein